MPIGEHPAFLSGQPPHRQSCHLLPPLSRRLLHPEIARDLLPAVQNVALTRICHTPRLIDTSHAHARPAPAPPSHHMDGPISPQPPDPDAVPHNLSPMSPRSGADSCQIDTQYVATPPQFPQPRRA